MFAPMLKARPPPACHMPCNIYQTRAACCRKHGTVVGYSSMSAFSLIAVRCVSKVMMLLTEGSLRSLHVTQHNRDRKGMFPTHASSPESAAAQIHATCCP